VLEFLVLTTVFCGFLGILWQKNLINKVIAMDVMSSGVVAYFVLMASRTGLLVPITTEPSTKTYADPVPQAIILTAIVIGFSIQALMLVCIMKLAKDHPTLEYTEIENMQKR
jgi:multicomponent Na+:H+ antiporter subunit C